jgi:hypothetical protein
MEDPFGLSAVLPHLFPSSQEPGFMVVQQDPASPVQSGSVTDAARTSLVNVARLDDLGPFRRSSSTGEGF